MAENFKQWHQKKNAFFIVPRPCINFSNKKTLIWHNFLKNLHILEQSILYNTFVNVVLGRPQQKHTQSEVKCPFQHDQRCLRVGLEVHFIDTRLTLGVEIMAHPTKPGQNFFRFVKTCTTVIAYMLEKCTEGCQSTLLRVIPTMTCQNVDTIFIGYVSGEVWY